MVSEPLQLGVSAVAVVVAVVSVVVVVVAVVSAAAVVVAVVSAAVVVAVVSAAAAAGFWGFVGVAGFCCDGVGWACGGVWSATRFVDSDEKQV